MAKLIIIRGNSGSGKSTISKEIRKRLPTKTAIIEQDYLRRIILKEKDTIEHSDIITLIENTVFCCLNLGYDVILEGILYKAKYNKVLKTLLQYNGKETFIFYLDISLDETLKRHKSKPNAHEFGELELRSWYKKQDYLDVEREYIIQESLSQQEVVHYIMEIIH